MEYRFQKISYEQTFKKTRSNCFTAAQKYGHSTLDYANFFREVNAIFAGISVKGSSFSLIDKASREDLKECDSLINPSPSGRAIQSGYHFADLAIRYEEAEKKIYEFFKSAGVEEAIINRIKDSKPLKNKSAEGIEGNLINIKNFAKFVKALAKIKDTTIKSLNRANGDGRIEYLVHHDVFKGISSKEFLTISDGLGVENLSEKLKVHFVDLTLSACNINSELKDPEIRGGIYKKLRLSDESMKSIERDFEKKYSNMYEDRRLGGGLDTTNYVPYSDVNNSKIKPLNFPRDKGEGK